jgi:uncharacterized protein (DUF924 family)
MEEKTVKKILNFWFGEMKNNGLPDIKKQKMWWIKDKELDNMIKKKFEKHLILAKSLEFDEIKENPKEILAVVILLDQFSRNIYRDSPRSFAQDNIALNIVLKGVEYCIDKKMKAVERAFFYMPLMHSEDIGAQEKSVKCFSGLEAEYKDSDDFTHLVTQNKKYAVLHNDIIKRFGRYPHRNKILGRESTAEEREFLKGPGSSF